MSVLLIFSHYCVYLICMFRQSSIGLHVEVKEQLSRRHSSPSAVGSRLELKLSGLQSKLLYPLSHLTDPERILHREEMMRITLIAVIWLVQLFARNQYFRNIGNIVQSLD